MSSGLTTDVSTLHPIDSPPTDLKAAVSKTRLEFEKIKKKHSPACQQLGWMVARVKAQREYHSLPGSEPIEVEISASISPASTVALSQERILVFFEQIEELYAIYQALKSRFGPLEALLSSIEIQMIEYDRLAKESSSPSPNATESMSDLLVSATSEHEIVLEQMKLLSSDCSDAEMKWDPLIDWLSLELGLDRSKITGPFVRAATQ